VKRPPNIRPVEAAGVTVAALSAYYAVDFYAKVKPGDTILVNGGSSSVGIFTIQFAKARGARVWATASGKNEALLRRIGVDEVSFIVILEDFD